MRLEVAVLPVSDVDRARRFNETWGLGWISSRAVGTMLLSRDPGADIRNEEGHDHAGSYARGLRPPFGEHVNAAEVEEVVALYEEDGCFVQRDGSAATGRSEIRKVITRLVEIRPALRGDVVRVMRAGENLAVLYNDWNLSANGRDGKRIERAGKAIEIVRRQADGTWLFAFDDPYARG